MTTRSDVFKTYLNNLGRVPDSSGWDSYTNYLDSGGTPDQIAGFMKKSGEYANTDEVIRNAYRTFLGREPSQQEVDNQKAGGAETHRIVKSIRDSQEAAEFRGGLQTYLDTYAAVEPGMQSIKDETGKSFESAYHAALYHWNTAGKYENRVIPGQPKILLNNDGTLAIGNPKWFSNNAYNNYLNTITRFNNAQEGGGQYMTLLNVSLDSLKDKVSQEDFQTAARNSIDYFYLKYKAPPAWDAASLTVHPPTGSFDPAYYAQKKPSAVTEYWNKVAEGDLDFIARYGNSDPFLYLSQDYTNVGRFQNIRGNKAVEAEAVTEFAETLTDAQKQQYRDQVLGITGLPGQEQLILATPKYDEEGNLLNEEELNTLLEQKFAQVLTARDLQKEKQLGTLAQDVLKTSINELKAAKTKESNLAVMQNLPGYNEILNINTTLANSILGDTGIGGLLSIPGAKGDVKSDLEKSIEKITGVSSNSTLYNWQKWFEDTLVKRYEDYEYEVEEYSPEELKEYQDRAKEEVANYNEQIKAGNTEAVKPVYLEIAEQYGENNVPLDINNIDDFKKIMFNVNLESQKKFVNTFITKYLKPRFDQSKSMDEFISYLDVKEDEQNIFQSQTTVNKLKQIADLRAKGFIDLINQSEKAVQNFNPAFYLDPVTNNTKQISAEKMQQYQAQKDTVASDFENAKNGLIGGDGINWAVEAYRYGLENNYKTDPEAFAKLHYQAKGRFLQTDANGKPYNFDPAEDILPYEELETKIKNFGAEMALRKELYGDASFMQFVTPEEYADSLLKSVDPTQNKEEWKKILDQLGLDYTEDIQQVKDYLVEAFRTEEAKTIRENIKYLNEAQEDLTQKKLGVSYIERPEDKKEYTEGQTALYNIFKNAGYGGTENDFYSDFMPDVDRSEQELIAQTMTEKGLTFEGLDTGDPLSAFTNLSGLFGDDGSVFEKDETADKPEPSYFNIFGEDEEELPQKSKAAESFLGEFTSMFAGFK